MVQGNQYHENQVALERPNGKGVTRVTKQELIEENEELREALEAIRVRVAESLGDEDDDDD